MDLEKRGKVWIYILFLINGSGCLESLLIKFWKNTSKGKEKEAFWKSSIEFLDFDTV